MLAQSFHSRFTRSESLTAGLSQHIARSQIMSRFVSEYEGANEEKHGELCVLVGDKVHDDVLGKGIAVRMDGAMIIIEFLEDGEHGVPARGR